MLGREYAVKITDIRELLRTARRYGMARARDDDEDPEQPLAIEILPALATLLPSTVAGRIGADYRRLESGNPVDDALEEPVDSEEARSEERRVGKECVSACTSRWWPNH